jgi:helix-turn-helix protein
MLGDAELSERARAVASALEPFAGQVYFSPECHAGYAALGFGPSPGKVGAVALPDGPAYFASRGSVMGQVPGTVIAAAFAVFNPAAVEPAVTFAWSITDAATIGAARTAGALGQLTRILGPSPDGVDAAVRLLTVAGRDLRPEGKPLYAGLAAQSLPDEPLGAAWRLADRLREYRGDAHTAAWTAAGLDAAEIGLMTELYWGLRARSYVRTRAWTDADLDAAEERLEARGLTRDGQLTEEGRRIREEIEVATDRQCRPIVDALGDDLSSLISIVGRWAADIRAAGGYLPSGPHDLAAAASRS